MAVERVRAGLADPQRIEVARSVLGEARREALGRLAVLGSRLLGAAHAAVSILTDEPVLVTPLAPGQPRPDALLARTVTGGPLALDDAGLDGIAAFLGVPVDVAGARVGALAVYDVRVGAWTPHDVELLSDLADSVAAELERGALAAELESSTVRLDLGFAAAEIGSFDWNLVTDELHWDERLMDLFGYRAEEFVPHIDSFSARLHPADRAGTEAAIRRAIDSRGEYQADYRVLRPDGSMRWVAARGRVLSGPGGRPQRMLGAAYDVTAVRCAAERLGRVLETMSTAFFTLDRSWRFTYVNAAAERIIGRRRDELEGRVIWEFEIGDSDWLYRRAMATGQPTSFEQYSAPLGAYFDVRVMPVDDGLSVYFHDITTRVRAEREREAALAESADATGRLRVLSAASARLATTLEVDELLAILGEIVMDSLGDGLVVGLADAGELRCAYAVHAADATLGARLAGTPLRGGDGPAATGELVPALAGQALGDTLGYALPLISRGRILGTAVVLGAVDSALDRRVLLALAARAGVALDNAVLYAAERGVALTLQRSLLPTALPDLPGIELAARYLPGAGGREVGGDFYLCHALEDGRLLLVIGDVVGHGPQAAARMGQLRAVLAAYAYDGDPPDRVLAHVSQRATALLDLPMATALAGIYDPPDRRFTFALAGHLPPLVAPEDGVPLLACAAPGPPLGAGVTAYARHTLTVPPRATLLLYTDGLIEDRAAPIDSGLEHLRAALAGLRLAPDGVCDHVLAALARAAGAEDDIALLAMRHR